MTRKALAADLKVLKVKADGSVVQWFKLADVEASNDFAGRSGVGNTSP
jgi:hypothetical protein